MLPLVGACASLDGQAEAVLSVGAVEQVAQRYPPAAALDTFYGLPPSQRKGFRDKVVGSYLAAADIRYLAFRRNLSREMKGSSLVLDLAVLGLTSGASLAGESAANALSAGAAGLTGTRASLSKELWFERALPALITAMDAQRTTVRTQILLRMQGSAEAYSLAEAFSDIARYEEAASLDAGISVVTAAANEKAVAADARYEGLVLDYSGAPPPGAADRMADIKTQLIAAKATPGKMGEVADALKIQRGATDDDSYYAILDAMDALDTPQKLDDFAATVSTALGAN